MSAFVRFTAGDLLPALRVLAGVTAPDDCGGCHYSNGVLFDFDLDRQLSLVATDGTCLSLFTFDLDSECKGQYIVSGDRLLKWLKEVKKYPEYSSVQFNFEGDRAEVVWGDETRECKLMDCKFPDYWRVIDPVLEPEGMTVAFNPLLIERAAGTDCQQVQINVTSAIQPIRVLDEKRSNFAAVVMPIRMG